MNDKPSEFRQLLFDSEQMSPALRASYDAALHEMEHPKFTFRSAFVGGLLMVVLIVCAALIVRNMFLYEVSALMQLAWGILATSFAYIFYLIARDLWRKQHSRQAQFSVAQVLTLAAGSVTVVSLIIGLDKPSDPASMFNAFFVFVFYFACIAWSLENRIAQAELAAREQMLRIECRLADLAARLRA